MTGPHAFRGGTIERSADDRRLRGDLLDPRRGLASAFADQADDHGVRTRAALEHLDQRALSRARRAEDTDAAPRPIVSRPSIVRIPVQNGRLTG